MSRLPRIWVPGGVYHLTLRGNNRQQIFLDAADYRQYLMELERCRARYPYRLLAFALMPNHVHVVVEASPQASLSELMRQVGGNYTRYFNARHQRVGHLYQGRFYSNLVDRDAYLLEVSRYVHLNPFRARLVRQPADYTWSSYQAYLGNHAHALDGLVEPERVLVHFGSTSAEQVERYRRFVEELVADEKEPVITAWLQRSKLIPPPRWLTPKSDSHFLHAK